MEKEYFIIIGINPLTKSPVASNIYETKEKAEDAMRTAYFFEGGDVCNREIYTRFMEED